VPIGDRYDDYDDLSPGEQQEDLLAAYLQRIEPPTVAVCPPGPEDGRTPRG
jgi:hypothetical protein